MWKVTVCEKGEEKMKAPRKIADGRKKNEEKRKSGRKTCMKEKKT